MIKYPNMKKNLENQSNQSNIIVVGNKGMTFEEEINSANNHYCQNDIAFIYKKPTPIKILQTKSYTDNFQKKVFIEKAVFEKKSTTDYNGIYKGRYIDFEAKETKYKSFNIKSNLHNHQREHLENVSRHGAIAFLIVRFTFCNRIFVMDIQDLNVENSLIPFKYFETKGIEVLQNKTTFLDYLKAVDGLLLRGKYE